MLHKNLVDSKKVPLLPLPIKLGSMKQFVNALLKHGECFQYLCNLSETKLKEDVWFQQIVYMYMYSNDQKNINRKNKTNPSFIFLLIDNGIDEEHDANLMLVNKLATILVVHVRSKWVY